MTQLDDDLTDLTRLVREDPLHAGHPDTAGLIRRGSRIRRRRQLAVTAGAGLAAAAVVAPFLLLGGASDTVAVSPADEPAASTASATSTPTARPPVIPTKLSSTPGVCGVAVCSVKKGAYGSVEEGELIGTQLEMGTFDGATEVLYAARTDGFDTSTGKPKANVDVLSAGVVVDGKLRRTVWAFQPIEDPTFGPVSLYGGERTISEAGEPHYGVFGYVAGEQASVTVTSTDGQSHPVTGLSTEVLPGYTVFFDTGAWNPAWTDRAELTFEASGGPSCSVQECGTVG